MFRSLVKHSIFQPPVTVLQLVALLERGVACLFRRMTTDPAFDKRIPDKWRDYNACGVPIKGERIIAFKTPLSNKFDNESDQDNGIKSFERFTPMDLQIHLEEEKWKLGLVVDLTNTFRYYNPRIFYQFCINIPLYDPDFIDVDSICHSRYLIECRGYTPEKAIAAFNEARGYPVERENYMQDLKTRTPRFEDPSLTQKEEREKIRIAYGSMSLYVAILHNVFLLYYVDIFVSVYKIDRNSFWLGEGFDEIWASLYTFIPEHLVSLDASIYPVCLMSVFV
ncbi:RNA/RNP complex-1-interacting phosphatase [Acropora cervicornis]|uniref:RNA/RNP complex-1-interacting phosphatase n=1 Tax=Acropora cervicornis TaxID=6130 RepID=A0AAD9PV71_ACRCE|nr:RNA/RNP complex-1-interacting phosphatase [Acropora cervicornis]